MVILHCIWVVSRYIFVVVCFYLGIFFLVFMFFVSNIMSFVHFLKIGVGYDI